MWNCSELSWTFLVSWSAFVGQIGHYLVEHVQCLFNKSPNHQAYSAWSMPTISLNEPSKLIFMNPVFIKGINWWEGLVLHIRDSWPKTVYILSKDVGIEHHEKKVFVFVDFPILHDYITMIVRTSETIDLLPMILHAS